MFVQKDSNGNIISGAFANFQEGVAEHPITEEEWQEFQVSQTTNVNVFSVQTPTQKLFQRIKEQPEFPWQKFYDSAKISVEAQAVFTLLFTGLTSNLPLDFIASRFKELLDILEQDPKLPKLTAPEMDKFREVLQESGVELALFFESETFN